MSHPASDKFPPVEKLSDEKLQAIVQNAPASFFDWTPREQDAKRELQRRAEITPLFTPEELGIPLGPLRARN